jgi:predicted phosphodiesterase
MIMRCYFFGDIHGNVHALERCLAHMEEICADRVYCLGDLVGWLPFGDRTLARMRGLDLPTVAGNHDLLVAGLFTDHSNQIDRMQATAYNAGLLSTVPGAGDYLLSLPLALEEKDYVVVHHSPFHLPSAGRTPNINCFNYLDETALASVLDSWRAYPQRFIFSGHDHDPAVYELPAGQSQDVQRYRPAALESLTLHLRPGSRYWIKAGSVGGPYRDGAVVANSVLYDSERETLTLFRLPYDPAQLSKELASERFSRNLPTIQSYWHLLQSFL